MKKNILIILVLFNLFSVCFAGKNDFYENGEQIRYMYVDASSGLRVRESPSLKANKIDYLFDRMIVEIVEIGDEATIDGITSNWVKIVLPFNKLVANYPFEGWIFGGYLTKNVKKFSTSGWTNDDLVLYLSRFTWINGWTKTDFETDGEYDMHLVESGLGAQGKYTVNFPQKKINIYRVVGDEDSSHEEYLVYDIISIEEDKLTVRYNGDVIEFVPAFFNNCNFYCQFFGDCRHLARYEKSTKKNLNALRFDFSSKELFKLDSNTELSDDFWKNIILMGIKLEVGK